MRRWLFAVGTVLFGACIPLEPDWLVVDARFRGILVEVVEPGGYGSLLNVPPDRHRAFVLPLDTIELEWSVATPPGHELQPPIWIACSGECGLSLWNWSDFAGLPDCPEPMPVGIGHSCRLGEGHRIRVSMGGAYAPEGTGFALVIVGSRHPDVTPAACLERLSTSPRGRLEPCIVVLREPPIDDTLFGLPFTPEAADAPPEVLAQEADTNPTVLGFTVTRERGGVRDDLVVDLGTAVPVRRGDRLHVEPRLAGDAAQEYWISVGDDEGVPWSGTLERRTEQFEYDVSFSEHVVYDPPDATVLPLTWVVPHDVVPTTLWLDIRDDRHGQAFVELQFVAEGDA